MDAAPSTASATFGDLLRRHRQAAGLTQEALAARTGLSVRGLSDLERGARATPREHTLHLLLAALGLVGAERDALVAASHRRLAPPPRRSAQDRLASELPVPLTTLIGRAAEVAAARTLLCREDVRLLTLIGPGGVGKTRLALHIAEEFADSVADGIRFVDLATTRDPGLVVTTIAQVLGLREMGNRPLAERLGALLRQKQVLLVLDNFEQVLIAAPQVADLLAACPRLKVLVTSRAVLHISGEHVFPVLPLTLPDPGHGQVIDQIAKAEAVRLFVDRAQAASPDFTLGAANATMVVAICRRLEGLPLAIELASARVAHLPLAALSMRLERRLPLLTGGPRDQPARLRTMRDAIAWSHDLLAPDEQRLFRRLAVFVGGCTLAAAEYVGGIGSDDSAGTFSVLDGLASLVEKSLVRQDLRASEPRYRMLETIREFALEALTASNEEIPVRQQHAAWYRHLAEQAHVGIPGPDQRQWLARSEEEQDNFSSALAWLLERGDQAAAQGMVGALASFWYVRGHVSEARTWVERALAGRYPTADDVRGGALLAAGWFAWAQGDYPQAIERLQDSLVAFRALGQDDGIAEALYVLGMVAEDRGEYGQAVTLLTEALGLFRALGATQWVGFVLNALGMVAYEQDNRERASAFFEEALVQFRAVGETNGIDYVLTNLGKIVLAAGDFDQAAMRYRECLALRREQGEPVSLAGCLRGLGIVSAVAGQCETAARLFGAAEVLRERIGLPQPRHHSRYERAMAICRETLGNEGLLASWQVGRESPLETAVAEALGVGVQDGWSTASPAVC